MRGQTWPARHILAPMFESAALFRDVAHKFETVGLLVILVRNVGLGYHPRWYYLTIIK